MEQRPGLWGQPYVHALSQTFHRETEASSWKGGTAGPSLPMFRPRTATFWSYLLWEHGVRLRRDGAMATSATPGVGILGRDGTPVPLGGNKQRAVLAATRCFPRRRRLERGSAEDCLSAVFCRHVG